MQLRKTTVELPDALVREAKRVAGERGTTLRALIEEGLRNLLDERDARREFRLRDASVDGQGISTEWREAGWDRLRDEIYDGRGA
jgi:hypothetical protein